MNKLLRTTKYIIDTYSLGFCEKINHLNVINLIKKYTKYINNTTDDSYKRNLMRAITFEEQIHQYPLQTFFEDNLPISIVSYLDIADSVGPGQIRVSLWAEKYKTNRQELINPETHFIIMNRHVDTIFSHLNDKGFPLTPEWVGTLWQNMNAGKVSKYGQRVLGFYNFTQSIIYT